MSLRSLFVDLNSFFASVEQAETPALRGRPVGVVPVLAETTCCIAASTEAKRHGVKTGTLVREARRLCPDITIVPARPALYVRYHHGILAAIDRHLPVAQIGSIDEMACALIGRERERERALALARAIKREIGTVGAGGLTCSVGIAPNDFLAKTASDMHKPDGLVALEAHELPEALYGLRLEDFCGIGPAMLVRLNRHGIRSVEQLCTAPRHLLRHVWGGIEGERFHARLHGEQIDPPASRRHSIGHSHVLAPELRSTTGADAVLKKLVQKAAMRLRGHDLLAGALYVKVKYLGAEAWEAAVEFDPCDDTRALLRRLAGLLAMRRDTAPVLAVGVTLGRLIERAQSSGSLFGASEERDARALNGVIDRINRRYGHNKIYFGGAQDALDAAPMRIAFNRIPDADHEEEAEKNELWLQRIRQARVLAEAAHRAAGERRVADRDRLPRKPAAR